MRKSTTAYNVHGQIGAKIGCEWEKIYELQRLSRRDWQGTRARLPSGFAIGAAYTKEACDWLSPSRHGSMIFRNIILFRSIYLNRRFFTALFTLTEDPASRPEHPSFSSCPALWATAGLSTFPTPNIVCFPLLFSIINLRVYGVKIQFLGLGMEIRS